MANSIASDQPEVGIKPLSAAASKKQDGPAELRRLEFQVVNVPIEGTTELIVHKWSEKAKRQMLEAQTTKGTRKKKEPRDPQADYEASMYRFEDGRHGFPALGFKSAIVGACRFFDGFPMTQAKIAIRILGESRDQLVPIVSGEPYMREDMVRLESGTADLRYRAGYWPWSAVLQIRFVASLLSLNSLLALVEAGGEGGVGEWRPASKKSQAGGLNGTYRVVTDD